jgi:hypothetical protein
MADSRDEIGCEAGEAVAEAVEVAPIEGVGEELVDDRKKVVEGGDRPKFRGVGRSKSATGGGDQKRRRDEAGGDLAVVERRRELAIGATDDSRGAGRSAVELEDACDIVAWRCGHGETIQVLACCARALVRGRGCEENSSK